jgi:hypothetical protein
VLVIAATALALGLLVGLGLLRSGLDELRARDVVRTRGRDASGTVANAEHYEDGDLLWVTVHECGGCTLRVQADTGSAEVGSTVRLRYDPLDWSNAVLLDPKPFHLSPWVWVVLGAAILAATVMFVGRAVQAGWNGRAAGEANT